MYNRRTTLLLLILAVALLCAVAFSVSVGVIDIPLPAVFRSLAQGAGLNVGPIETQHQLILWKIRWPRVIMSAMVGATLSLCGAAMQGLFRNPLADPSLIGVSGGASVGASIAIVLGTSLLAGLSESLGIFGTVISSYLISIFAFAGGFAATLLVYRIGTSSNGTSVATMLLAGIAISALAGAFSNFFSYVADDIALRRISLWRMGSLDGANWHSLSLSFPLFVAVLIALPLYRRELNMLLLGESEARHLGVNVDKLKTRLIAWTALGVGVAVSVAGIIGFVGLVVPHLIRLIIGPDHLTLMPASALLGALLLVLADCLAHNLLAPIEIPIGIVTACLGAPFFISLLLQQRQRMLLQ